MIHLIAIALMSQQSAPLDIGQKATDVVLTDMAGKSVALSSFAGKKLIVFNWASW